VGILDFYHAAGHLWKAARTLFDGRSTAAKDCFNDWRHLLRHGGHQLLLTQLTHLINMDHLCTSAELEALIQVQSYLQTHHEHIRYSRFDKHGYPLGSGMVESACKWLIQQRFKGVGMRWSDDGCKHLLQLRVLMVNQAFDDLFPTVNWAEHLPSPKF
ncbi:MAG: ISKra4 family transposase, partial [Symploca sp. SIO1B1]|nr:ISKra4 family transposase [Symploca sp. SIO1B1]